MDFIRIHDDFLWRHNDGAAGGSAPRKHQRTKRTGADGRRGGPGVECAMALARNRRAGAGNRHRAIWRTGRLGVAYAVRRERRPSAAAGIREDSPALVDAVCFDARTGWAGFGAPDFESDRRYSARGLSDARIVN